MLRRFLADDGADARKYADATDHRHLKKCSRYARMRNAVNWHFVPKLRDELLDREIFYTLTEAQILIERWRRQYNTVRPRSALGYRPPAPEAIMPAALGSVEMSSALS